MSGGGIGSVMPSLAGRRGAERWTADRVLRSSLAIAWPQSPCCTLMCSAKGSPRTPSPEVHFLSKADRADGLLLIARIELIGRADVDDFSGCRVGAVGMCLTGAFVIPLVLEPCVVAPVISQPAIPFSTFYLCTGLGGTKWGRQLNVSDAEIAAAAARLGHENITLLAFRFEEDRLCPKTRFDRLREEFKSHLEAHEYECCSTLRRWFAPRHSVLTEEYSASQHENPSRIALRRLCDFLRENLNPS
jgi:hypothetical protein